MSATSTAPANNRTSRRAFVWLTAALLVYVSWEALRSDPGGSSLSQMDKLLHFGAFMALSTASALALAPGQGGALQGRRLLGLAGAWLFYGVLIEVLQTFVPGRESSGLDVLADAVGIAAGLALAHLVRRLPALNRLL